MSNFHSDTRGWWWTLFKAHLFSCAVEREEHCKQITLACARSVLATLGLPRSRCVCFPCLHCLDSRLLCQKLSEASPGCMFFPGLSHSGSGTWVVLRGADSVGPAFCALSQVQAAQVTRCLASTVFVTYHLPCLCRSIFWVYNRRTFSGRFQPSRIPRSLD